MRTCSIKDCDSVHLTSEVALITLDDRITELEAERDELVEALLAFALKISPSTPVFPREWLQAIKLISAIKGKPWEEIEAVVTKG